MGGRLEPVDLGGELGQGVELRLALAPVVVRRPVAREGDPLDAKAAEGYYRQALALAEMDMEFWLEKAEAAGAGGDP